MEHYYKVFFLKHILKKKSLNVEFQNYQPKNFYLEKK